MSVLTKKVARAMTATGLLTIGLVGAATTLNAVPARASSTRHVDFCAGPQGRWINLNGYTYSRGFTTADFWVSANTCNGPSNYWWVNPTWLMAYSAYAFYSASLKGWYMASQGVCNTSNFSPYGNWYECASVY